MVLGGEITVTRDSKAATFQAGDHCKIPAGCQHTTKVGPEGVAYLVDKAYSRASVIESALIDLSVRCGEEVEPCLPGLFCLGGNDRPPDRLHLIDAVSEMTLWPARARQVDLPLRCLCVRFRQMPWRCGKN